MTQYNPLEGDCYAVVPIASAAAAPADAVLIGPPAVRRPREHPRHELPGVNSIRASQARKIFSPDAITQTQSRQITPIRLPSFANFPSGRSPGECDALEHRRAERAAAKAKADAEEERCRIQAELECNARFPTQRQPAGAAFSMMKGVKRSAMMRTLMWSSCHVDDIRTT